MAMSDAGFRREKARRSVGVQMGQRQESQEQDQSRCIPLKTVLRIFIHTFRLVLHYGHTVLGPRGRCLACV